jgi:hypothetical protein
VISEGASATLDYRYTYTDLIAVRRCGMCARLQLQLHSARQIAIWCGKPYIYISDICVVSCQLITAGPLLGPLPKKGIDGGLCSLAYTYWIISVAPIRSNRVCLCRSVSVAGRMLGRVPCAPLRALW